MISERNFTKASAAAIRHQAQETRQFLRKMEKTQVVEWNELIELLERNKELLEYSASELVRVSSQKPQIEELRAKVEFVQNCGRIH